MTRLPPLLLLIGCTFEPGTGFATLEQASVTAVLEPGEARDLGQRTLLTDQAYEVTLDEVSLELGALTMEAISGGDSSSFDPANPPPGYNNCHNGHCHADDGSLPSYAEVEAATSDGPASFVPVVSLPVDATVDLWEGARLDLIDRPRSLDAAEVRRLQVEVGTLTMTGEVTGGALEDDVVPLSVRLPLDTTLGADLPLTLGRTGPERVRPHLRITVDGTLFDGLPLATWVQADRIELDRETGGAAVTENLLTSEVNATR